MPNYEKEKEIAAAASLEFIEDGMAVGLGSGSTARLFVKKLGKRVRKGLKIRAIPTSRKTSMLAEREGIPLTDFSQINRLDVSVDGADEVDPQLNLIKGGGGALLREKIVAAATDCFIIVIDSRKIVTTLGAFPLPVEVVAFGWQNVANAISKMGAEVKIRLRPDGKPFLTNQGNYILDCDFNQIPDPVELGEQLRSLIGVVEHGLFVGLTDVVVVGKDETAEIIRTENAS